MCLIYSGVNVYRIQIMCRKANQATNCTDWNHKILSRVLGVCDYDGVWIG
jgi:hypothetical protein